MRVGRAELESSAAGTRPEDLYSLWTHTAHTGSIKSTKRCSRSYSEGKFTPDLDPNLLASLWTYLQVCSCCLHVNLFPVLMSWLGETLCRSACQPNISFPCVSSNPRHACIDQTVTGGELSNSNSSLQRFQTAP